MVTEKAFSQAPVKTGTGFALITTNAVARWFAANMAKQGGIVDMAPISDVLAFAEAGDQLRTATPTTTVVEAINTLSGQARPNQEPPAALLLLGKVGEPPQALCTRADLALLYAQLEI